MKKRALVTIPVILILTASVIASFFLTNEDFDKSRATPAQRIAAYTKPSVVRILDEAIVQWDYSNISNPQVYQYIAANKGQTIIGGSGSGAIVSSDGHIITNAHVIDLSRKTDQELANEALEYLAYDVASYFNVSPETAYDYLLSAVTWKAVTRIQKVYLPNGEAYNSTVKAFGAPVGEGEDVAVLKISATNLPILTLGNSNMIQLQDNIWVIGFPAAADSDLLSQESQLVSSITSGQVSAIDKKAAEGTPVIQIDAAVTHGNSGGPVVNEQGEIIGLLTFRGDTVYGNEIQGFSFAIPSTTVQKFMQQAGVNNTLGPVDISYREGLQFFWSGYYKEALKKFEEAAALYGKHPEIQRLIQTCQYNLENSKTYWPRYSLFFYIFDGIAVLLIVFLSIITFKPHRQPALQQKPNIEYIFSLIKNNHVDAQEILNISKTELQKKQQSVQKE
ncbi:MAG: S1C family serine protease [Ectobacillus sp.]